MKILTFTTLFPNNVHPLAANFVRERMTRAADNFHLRVVAPVPWSPPLPLNDRWGQFRRVCRSEDIGGIEVHHPRYALIPRIGMSMHGCMMFASTHRFLRELRRSYPFDLIDAHYIYPDGLAAVLHGQRLGVPVVLSARGSDVNVFPQFRTIRPWIRYALREAASVISVSIALKRKMVQLGCPEAKIHVIPNAVDHRIFRRMNRSEARRELGEALAGKMLLSVGNLKPAKGFRLLLEAFDRLRDRLPDVRLRIIGDGPDRGFLARRINELGLDTTITLVGTVPNGDLPLWYCAADAFALASEGEGNPNVVNESLACGTPVVTADLWEGELPYGSDQGVTAERLEPEAFAIAMESVLNREWDPEAVASAMRPYTWDDVSLQLTQVFAAAINGRQQPR